jgi:hypothetical protein
MNTPRTDYEAKQQILANERNSMSQTRRWTKTEVELAELGGLSYDGKEFRDAIGSIAAPSFLDGILYSQRKRVEAIGIAVKDDEFLDGNNRPVDLDWIRAALRELEPKLSLEEVRRRAVKDLEKMAKEHEARKLEAIQAGPVGTEPVQTIDQVLTERGKRYGKFKDHARITQDLKDVMRSTNGWEKLSPSQKEALEMTAHKIGRILNGGPSYADNFIDLAGYNQLVADELQGVVR